MILCVEERRLEDVLSDAFVQVDATLIIIIVPLESSELEAM